jgi:hypothetical protein
VSAAAKLYQRAAEAAVALFADMDAPAARTWVAGGEAVSLVDEERLVAVLTQLRAALGGAS